MTLLPLALALLMGVDTTPAGVPKTIQPPKLRLGHRMVLLGGVYTPNKEQVGSFEAVRVVVANGSVFYTEAGDDQVYGVAPGLIVVIVVTEESEKPVDKGRQVYEAPGADPKGGAK